MSWDSYCVSLKSTGAVKRCGLYGLDGNQWAADGLNWTQPEVASVLAMLRLKIPGGSVIVGGLKFMVMNGETETFVRLVGPVVSDKAEQYVYYVGMSKQCIVAGGCPREEKPGECSEHVQKISDYLKSVGY